MVLCPLRFRLVAGPGAGSTTVPTTALSSIGHSSSVVHRNPGPRIKGDNLPMAVHYSICPLIVLCVSLFVDPCVSLCVDTCMRRICMCLYTCM